MNRRSKRRPTFLASVGAASGWTIVRQELTGIACGSSPFDQYQLVLRRRGKERLAVTYAVDATGTRYIEGTATSRAGETQTLQTFGAAEVFLKLT